MDNPLFYIYIYLNIPYDEFQSTYLYNLRPENSLRGSISIHPPTQVVTIVVFDCFVRLSHFKSLCAYIGCDLK